MSILWAGTEGTSGSQAWQGPLPTPWQDTVGQWVPQQSRVYLGTKCRSRWGGKGSVAEGDGTGELLTHRSVNKAASPGLDTPPGTLLVGRSATSPPCPTDRWCGVRGVPVPPCPNCQRPLPAQPSGSSPTQQKPVLPQEHGRATAANCTASEGLRKPNLPQEI